MLRYAIETVRDKAAVDNPGIEKEMRNFQIRALPAIQPTTQVPETFCGTKPVLRNWGKGRK